jgi:hypothetical protein
MPIWVRVGVQVYEVATSLSKIRRLSLEMVYLMQDLSPLFSLELLTLLLSRLGYLVQGVSSYIIMSTTKVRLSIYSGFSKILQLMDSTQPNTT